MKTNILSSTTFFRILHCLWDNVEKYSGHRGATTDVTIWRIRHAWWLNKVKRTYANAHAHAPGYPHERTHAQACTHRPIDNTYCFPHQQWFRERAWMLRYTHIPCLVTPHIEIVSNVRVTYLQPLWGFLCNSKAKLGFCKKCRHKFRRKFPGVPFLQRKRKSTDTCTFEQHLSR